MKSNQFYIESMGCPGNRADGGRIQGFFLANGWQETVLEKAKIVVFNTCAVTQYHENKAVERIRQISQEMNATSKLIIAGCLDGISPKALEGIDCERIGPKSIEKLDAMLNEKPLVSAAQVSSGVLENGAYSLRVATGCLGACAYCAIPFANGRIKSLFPEQIIAVIRQQYEKGQRKFKLTAEDVGAYGQDIGLSLPTLLTELSAEFADISIIVDTLNPNWALKYLDALIAFLRAGVLADSLYIPFQSGSDRMLRLMQRAYSVADVEVIFSRLYQEFPAIKISTDILVGFPFESDEDFALTVQLLKLFPYHLVSVFEYQDREGTNSSQMADKVSDEVKSERKEALVAEILARIIRERNITSKEELFHFLAENDTLPANINFHLS